MTNLFLRIFIAMVLTVMLSWTFADWLTKDAYFRDFRTQHHYIVGLMLQTFQKEMSIEDPQLRYKALEQKSDPRLYMISVQPISSLELTAGELELLRAGEMVSHIWMDEWTGGLEIYLADRDPDQAIVFETGELMVQAESRYHMIVEICMYTGLALVSLFLIIPLMRRLRTLAKTAEAFGDGDFDARVPAGGPKAIADLGGAFNQMADQLKRAGVRHQITTHALSHEVRTPLARLRLSLDMTRDMELPEHLSSFVQDMQRDVDDLENLSDEMLSWARLSFAREALPMETIDLSAMAGEVVEALQDVCPEIPLKTAHVSDQLARGNKALLARALGNLVRNAQKYGAKNIEIQVSLNDKEARLIVDDDGPGIPPEDRERVLFPFVGSERNRANKGYGLGMAIVAQIAESHNGRVFIEDSPMGGARICFVWSS